MKKIIILFLFLLTGCTVNYNIEINENLELDETILINFENSNKFIQNNGYKNKEEYIDNVFEELNKNHQVTRNKDTLKISNHKTLKDLNNENLEEIYKSFYSECNNNICKIIGKSNKNPNLMIGNYIISIKLKNKVYKNNANKIDLIKDTYIWYYNNDVKSDIEIIFSKNEIKNLNNNKVKYYSLLIISSLTGFLILIFLIRFYIKTKRNTYIS